MRPPGRFVEVRDFVGISLGLISLCSTDSVWFLICFWEMGVCECVRKLKGSGTLNLYVFGKWEFVNEFTK